MTATELMTNWPDPSTNQVPTDGALTFVNTYAVLEVTGEDTEKFLQGQCSADIGSLAIGESVPGSICTVKGRVITSFIATKTNESVLLLIPRVLVPTTKEYLKKYAAFFKVSLNQWLHPCVIANPKSGQLPESLYVSCNFRLGEQGFHAGLLDQASYQKLADLLPSDQDKENQPAPESIWLDHLLEAGWLLLNNKTSEEYLPHQLNLDLLGAINFKKGCYTGQEIIARMEYRGKSKKRLKVISLSGHQLTNESLPLDIKTADDSQPLGELLQLTSNAKLALALLPVELPSEGSFICDGETLEYALQNNV